MWRRKRGPTEQKFHPPDSILGAPPKNSPSSGFLTESATACSRPSGCRSCPYASARSALALHTFFVHPEARTSLAAHARWPWKRCLFGAPMLPAQLAQIFLNRQLRGALSLSCNPILKAGFTLSSSPSATSYPCSPNGHGPSGRPLFACSLDSSHEKGAG